jgi:predicted enzyme related to lactoylglutathione lyase
MNDGAQTIIYPVKDIESAKAFYAQLLDVEPYTENPYYVGFQVGDQEIGLNPHGLDEGVAGPVVYYHVSDLASQLSLLLAAGASLKQDSTDVGGGKLIATVVDASGNTIGLLQPAR